MTALLKIGNRIINREKITHCSFEPQGYNPEGSGQTSRECVVSFGSDECQVFFDDEADQVWTYLSVASTNITPHKQLNAAA